MANEKVLIIGGGVGPMAGVALHARIIENTLPGGSDQGHLDVRHFSRSADVTDRTEFLLGRQAVNPSVGMARTIGMAVSGLGGSDAVVGVPCNTFHAPTIFRPFTDQLTVLAETAGLTLQVMHMLEETMILLKVAVSGPGIAGSETLGAETVGVMSTTGTRISGVYDTLLAASGFRPLYVDETDQDELHAAIYDPVWGIKATGQPGKRAITTLMNLAVKLADKGAKAIILGCTELPLALTESSICGIPLVDPVLALARSMIREAAPAKLAPLLSAPAT